MARPPLGAVASANTQRLLDITGLGEIISVE